MLAGVAGEDQDTEWVTGGRVLGASQAVRLGSFLLVELCRDEGLTFLDVRSRIDPSQGCLLSLAHGPALVGLCFKIRLSRLAAVRLAFAYGVGPLPEQPSVRFDTGTVRFRYCVDAVPQLLAPEVWVAAAEGIFAGVSLQGADTGPVDLEPRPLHHVRHVPDLLT